MQPTSVRLDCFMHIEGYPTYIWVPAQARQTRIPYNHTTGIDGCLRFLHLFHTQPRAKAVEELIIHDFALYCALTGQMNVCSNTQVDYLRRLSAWLRTKTITYVPDYGMKRGCRAMNYKRYPLVPRRPTYERERTNSWNTLHPTV